MKRVMFPVVILTCLAACGADGEPEQPAPEDGRPGVRVTGDAEIGMAVGQSGTRGYGSVGLTNGPVSFRMGF